MVDNVTLDSGSGGATVKTDDDGTAHWQYIKLAFGADNTQTRVTTSVGLPVDIIAGTAEIGNVKNSGTFVTQATLQAGTAEIGKLAAGTATIGEVTIGTATTAATDLAKAEDAAHSSADVGIMALSVRQNTAASTSGTDGDYQPLITDTNGRLHTNDVSTAAALSGSEFQVDIVAALPAGTNEIGKLAAGTAVIGEVTIGAATGAAGDLAKLEDAAHSSSDVGVMALSVRSNTAASTSGTDGDYQPLITDTNGRLHTNDVSTAAALSGSEFQVDVVAALPAGSNTIGVVDLGATDNAVLDQIEVNTSYGDNTGAGTEANSLRVTIANNSTGLLSVDDNGGSLTIDNAQLSVVGGGTEAAAMRVTIASDSTGVISIDDNGGAITVDNGGTFATQATLQTGANTIGEVTIGTATTAATDLAKAQDVAVGANDVGMALMVKRDDEQAAITPADGDYVVPTCDKFGKLKITELPDATSEVKYAVVNVAGSGDNTIQAAAGAGIKIRVLSVLLISAGTVNARFESAAGGTALTGVMPLVANSGFQLAYNPHGWFETADNALLNLELSGAVSVDGCITYVEV